MKQKFKRVDKALDRILWDPKYKGRQDEFMIGYEDRFLGLMEVSIRDYLNSEIKSHRIHYFRCGDDKVWDRSTRTDNF